MTAEELNIKIKLDLSEIAAGARKLKQDLAGVADKVRQSLPNITSESRRAEDALEDVSDAAEDVSDNIEKIGDASKKNLSDVTDRSSKLERTLHNVSNASNQTNASLGSTEASDAATSTADALSTVQDTMSSIMSLDFAGLLLDNLERFGKQLKGIQDSFKSFGANFKDTMVNIKNMFSTLGRSFKKDMADAWGDDVPITFEDRMMQLRYHTFQAGQAIKGMAKNIGTAMLAAGSFVLALSPLIMAISAVALAVNALRVSELGEKMYVNAQKAGMSTTAYQEWAYVLERSGIEADELAEITKTLTEAQLDVISGSEDMTAAFGKLGMSAQQVANMSQQELWNETIRQLQNVGNVTERAAIAYQILGEDAANITTVLNLTNQETGQLISTYHQLGAAMSQELIVSSNHLQGSVTNLKYAWQGLKNTLAQAVMPAIIAVVNWITKAIAVVNMFLKVIFGISLTVSGGTSGGMTGAVNSGTTALKDYTTGANKATGAAEKLKRSMMGFDELNKVTDPKSASGGGGSSGGGGGGGGVSVGGGGVDTSGILNTESLGLEKIQAWFEKYKNIIQDITTVTLLGIGVIGTILCIMGGNFIGAAAFAAMAGLGWAIGSVEGGTFDRLLENVKKWWENVKAWWGEHVAPIFTKDFWVKKWEQVTEPIRNTMTVIKAVLAFAWTLVKVWFKTNVAPIFTKEFWVNKWNEVTEPIRAAMTVVKAIFAYYWTLIKAWFKTNIAPIFTLKYWQDIFKPVTDALTDMYKSVKNKCSEAWNGVKQWFTVNVAPKFTKGYWLNKFASISNGITSKLSAARDAIKNAWNSIKDWYNTHIAPKFTLEYWKGVFSSIGEGAKAAFNGVISIVENAVNNIVDKINTLSWTIPSWVPAVGGEKFGFNVSRVKIPRLATGGIVTDSTIANVGEAGAEAVLPLTGSQSQAWMDILADKLAERMGNKQTTVSLNVDGTALGWATINNINAITQQTGGLQLSL